MQLTKLRTVLLYFTYSLLIRDVELRFGIRLQLIFFKSCIDPPILHDLLQIEWRQSEPD